MPEDPGGVGEGTIFEMQHDALNDELRGQLSLYTLGLLEAEAAHSCEDHLLRCALCAEEVRADMELIATVAVTEGERMVAVAQVPDMRAALMKRIANEPSAQASALILRSTEGVWKKVLPGIEVKRLFIDPVTQSVTSLVRVAAGAVYPAHIHRGLEHLYVLDGDIVFDDHTLSTGDYEVRTPDTRHSSATTAPGENCLLLVVNCERDEFIL